MAAAPVELSVTEIRNYMLANDCKVTNHALVKHFKQFLTKPETQNEARKLFKVYVNVLATIKNENNQKYLLLRKKYIDELPTEDVVVRAMHAAAPGESVPGSPGGASLTLEGALASPSRQPPPYVPPPNVDSPQQPNSSQASNDTKSKGNDDDIIKPVVDESPLKTNTDATLKATTQTDQFQKKDPQDNLQMEVEKRVKSISRGNSQEDPSSNKENIPRFSFSSGNSSTSVSSAASGGRDTTDSDADIVTNPLSVKEATRKFNRMASEEEAKASSPSSKKKPEEKQPTEEKNTPDVTIAHPKAKEWIVAMAKASYQELAKLANEYPELVKLADPYTGYTALHWAAKHGNADVVKLIAGTYKANVNARTNGGYTPLHISMQFGRADIFELLCNVYKANRDLMDWSGNKPLDYSKQSTSVSASTYSKIKAKRKHGAEKDLGFLRIGSLNVRVKKTTEAFSNFLGVGNGHSLPQMGVANRHHQRSHRHHHHGHHHHPHDGMTRNHNHPHQHHQRHQIVSMPPTIKSSATTATTTTMTKKKTERYEISSEKQQQKGSRASVPINSGKFDKLHKSWGSADNIPLPHTNIDADTAAKEMMPPPKNIDSISAVKKRQKGNANRSSVVSSNATDSPRDSISSSNSSSNLNSGYSSMPTTPNQLRAPIGIGLSNSNALVDSDSDSACGFGSNWSIGGSGGGTRTSVSSGNLQTPKF